MELSERKGLVTERAAPAIEWLQSSATERQNLWLPALSGRFLPPLLARCRSRAGHRHRHRHRHHVRDAACREAAMFEMLSVLAEFQRELIAAPHSRQTGPCTSPRPQGRPALEAQPGPDRAPHATTTRASTPSRRSQTD